MVSLFILRLTLAVIFIEAITNVIRDEEISKPIRNFLNKSIFFKSMLECGRCTAFHVSWMTLGAFLLIPDIFMPGAIIFCSWRLSNVLHDLYGIIKMYKFRKI